MTSIRKVADAIRKGAEGPGPAQYAMADKPIRCPHCSNRTFQAGEAQLNTALLTFFKLDWLDESATVLFAPDAARSSGLGKSRHASEKEALFT